MAWKKNLKKYARKGAKVVGRAIKKRYVGKKGVRIGRIVKDVAMIKRMINAEKKRIDTMTGYISTASQFTCNAAGTNLDTGYIIKELTPLIAPGTSASQRNGDSVKLSSMQLQLQFAGQANLNQPCRLIVELWKHKTEYVTTDSTTMFRLFNTNAISGWTDTGALRNQDYFSDFVCLGRKSIYMPADNYAGQVLNKDILWRKKLNSHVRYLSGGTTIVQGQIFMTIRASVGNKGSANATTGFTPWSTPPLLTATSGVNVYAACRYYYYDN